MSFQHDLREVVDGLIKDKTKSGKYVKYGEASGMNILAYNLDLISPAEYKEFQQIINKYYPKRR